MTKEKCLEILDKILNRELKPWEEPYRHLVVIPEQFIKELKQLMEKK